MDNSDPYELVAGELRAGVRHDGLWVRSWGESGGDEKKAWSIYIRLRAAELASAIVVTRAQAEAEAKRHAEEARRQVKARTSEEWADLYWGLWLGIGILVILLCAATCGHQHV